MIKNSSNRCSHMLGVIFQQRCDRTKNLQLCQKCGSTFCDKHFSIEHLKCSRCIPMDNSRSFISSNDSFSSSSSSSSEPAWTGDGGKFSGGGASGGWDGSSGKESAATDNQSDFTPADFAAFDQITAADRINKSESYDS